MHMITRPVLLAAFVLCTSAAQSPPFLLGINIDPMNPAGYPTLANLTDLGAGAVRVEFKDSSTGTPTPSQQALSFYADVVARYTGLQTLFILDYSTLGGFPAPTAPDSEWDTYVCRGWLLVPDVHSLLR
jgi:hypothetical protein